MNLYKKDCLKRDLFEHLQKNYLKKEVFFDAHNDLAGFQKGFSTESVIALIIDYMDSD